MAQQRKFSQLLSRFISPAVVAGPGTFSLAMGQLLVLLKAQDSAGAKYSRDFDSRTEHQAP
jgi:hypothetical protein